MELLPKADFTRSGCAYKLKSKSKTIDKQGNRNRYSANIYLLGVMVKIKASW